MECGDEIAAFYKRGALKFSTPPLIASLKSKAATVSPHSIFVKYF
jgi:hypothetical protein